MQPRHNPASQGDSGILVTGHAREGQHLEPTRHLLRLTDITKSYTGNAGRTTVLRDVDFSAEDGEVVWLRGPSGSGKSSLLRIAGLLSSPDSGVVEIMGARPPQVKDAHAIRRLHLGMVFQNGNLMPDLSVRDNVAIAAVRAASAAPDTPPARRQAPGSAARSRGRS